MKKNKAPKIVAIGGGTGLSTMLRGLKSYTPHLTAVVTVADDGGSSGMLRNDLGILPPGDIRNCILALSEIEPVMGRLLQYRFTEGSLSGQSFGNLFLAAMCGITRSFDEAVQQVSDVLRVTGRVLPVTIDNVTLVAALENGETVRGESKIGHAAKDHGSRIRSVRLEPENITPLPDVLEAIAQADMIVLGPGSLYTSIIPNLMVPGVGEAILNSSAIRVYVCNIMTQPGETDGMSAHEHTMAICAHGGGMMIDYCIVNSRRIPPHLFERYAADGAAEVTVSQSRFRLDGIRLVEDDFLWTEGMRVRHDYERLAKSIIDLSGHRPKKKKSTAQRDFFSRGVGKNI